MVALLGLFTGAAFNEASHRFRQHKSAESFEKRLRCRALADAYAKTQSGDNVSVFVKQVDFSKKRSSCVVAIDRGKSANGHTSWDYYTIDLITGEELFHGACGDLVADQNYSCRDGRDIKLMQSRDEVLQMALPRE